MGRKAKEARLWLRPARHVDGKVSHQPAWFILDGGRQIATGCAEDQRIEAESKLLEHVQGRAPKRIKYVYFITTERPDFPVKIGISETHKVRMAAMQIGLPYPVKALAIVPTEDPLLERRLHRKFAATRLSGEWFERTPELLAYIDHLVALGEAA